MMNQIGQPAASMIDSTSVMLLRKSAGIFARAPRFHKGLGNACTSTRSTSAAEPPKRLNRAAAAESCGVTRCKRVCRQASAGVAIHPQSLWISLWTSFRRDFQVAYRKGFFLFCSRI